MHGGTQETGNPGNQQTGRGTAAATAASAAASETAAAAAADCKCYLRGAMILCFSAAARGSGSGTAGAVVSGSAAEATAKRLTVPRGRDCKIGGIAKTARRELQKPSWFIVWLAVVGMHE